MYQDNRVSNDGGYTLAGGFFIIVAVAAGIFVAIGSIVGALVVSGLTRALAGSSLPYKQAYKVAFWGLAAWLAVTVALGAANDHIGFMLIARSTHWQQILDGKLLHVLAIMLPAHLPGIMLYAALMRKRLPKEYGSIAGYLLACLVSSIAVAVSVIFSAIVLLAVINGLLEANGVDTAREVAATMPAPRAAGTGLIVAQLLQLWAAAFVFAVVGGLAAGVVLLGYAVLQRRSVSYSRAYGAAFLALLAWAVATIIIEFWLGTVSPFLKWLVVAIEHPQQLISDVTNVAQVKGSLQAFLLSQIPGLLAAANFVSGQIHPDKPGVVRYASALIASAVAANFAIVASVAVAALLGAAAIVGS